MDDTDLIPVRETNGLSRGAPRTAASGRLEDGDATGQRAAQQKRMVAKWSRDDLEDKYFRMYEENILLKKHGRKQEDKIKRMATKLLRLVNDKKKTEQDTGVKKVRDIETEEMLEELHEKIRDYEKQNHQLKEKLMVTKQQLATQGKRTTKFDYVPSRIDTGMPKAPVDPRIAKGIRVVHPPKESARSIQNPGLPRYGHSLLEEARAENKHLEDVIAQLNEQLNIYEQDIELLKEQNRVREAEHEEDLLKIKQQLSQGQRNNIQENIDIIRLQREVKDKSSQFVALQSQYSNMEEKLNTMRGTHNQVLREMERQNQQLKEEENRVLVLQNQLKNMTQHQRTLMEFQERVADLENEKKILQEANEKLLTSAFDLEREREWRQRENALKVQIAQLEATLKADVGEKGGILDKLAEEREKHDKLEEETRELRVKYFQIKQDHDNLQDKMKFFTQESAVDFQEIEEALMLVKTRKEKGNQELDFLVKVDDERQKDLQKALISLEAEHAETINELEKTRNMLIVQHKINKDYQMEVEAVTRKMEDNKSEYESKLEEYAQLLDIRAVRVKKLESQIRDVAYGTRQHRIRDQEEDEVEEIDETLHLQRGQNMFEIHIQRMVLSADAIKHLGDEEPSVFCTWEFYEFEIQATQVMKSAKPEFDFTSQYQVTVDDFFLHFLMKESTTLELHQSFGTDYRTVAACQLKFREILDKSQGRIFGTAQLIGVDSGGSGVNYGTVEYWIRLRVPMDQALRLYKERTKALGYLHANMRATEQSLQALDDTAARQPDDNVNELHIKVIKCTDVKSRRQGVQPSPYCVYKFFDFSDHDTTIIPGSNSPQFNDHKTFPVPVTADLDKYLKSQPLQIYVFDDTDPEEAEYLGYATVPLIPLSHDKVIKGTFELKKSDGTVNGSMDVQLHWQYAYIPPRASTKTPAQILATTPEKLEKIPMMPGEETPDTSIMASAPVTMTTLPATVTFAVPPTPAAKSTPKKRHAVPVETEQSIIEQRLQAEQTVNLLETQAHQPVVSEISDNRLPLAQPPKPSPRQKGLAPASASVREQGKVQASREAPIEPPESVQDVSAQIQAPSAMQETIQSDVVSEGTPVSGESEPVSSAGEESGRGTPTSDLPAPLSVHAPTVGLATLEDDEGDSTDTLVEEGSWDDGMDSDDEHMNQPESVMTNTLSRRKKRRPLPSSPLTDLAKTQTTVHEASQPPDLPVKAAVHKRGKGKPVRDSMKKSLGETLTATEEVTEEVMDEDISDAESLEEDTEGQGQTELEDTESAQPESTLEDTRTGAPESTLEESQMVSTGGAEELPEEEATEETKEQDIEPEEKQKKGKFSLKSIFSRKGKDKGKEKEKKSKGDKKGAKVVEKEEVAEVVEELESSAPVSARDEILSSDSEGVVLASPKSRPTSSAEIANIVTVEVSHLTLDEDNPITDNPDIKMLFVEYRFLNLPLGELETPFSLPKPKPFHKITFNFKKVFHVDFKENYERRQYLASMLLPDDPDEGRIWFTVVSEPPEDLEDGECEDVGVAYVSIRDILKTKKDLINTDLPVYDIRQKDLHIGSLNVTVEAVAALTAVELEMKAVNDDKTV